MNDKGEFADLDGVLLTMEMPTNVEIEPGELPEMEFTPYVEVTNIPELKFPKKEVQIAQPEIPLLEIKKPEVRLRRILNQLKQEEKHLELERIVNELQEEERKIDFETFTGVLKQNEKTVELAEVLSKLPEKEQQVLMDVLNEMIPAGFATQEDFKDFEVEPEEEELLQALFLKYGY